MKQIRIWLPLLLLILALGAMSIAAAAAENTVVYLADGGKGDGSSAKTRSAAFRQPMTRLTSRRTARS